MTNKYIRNTLEYYKPFEELKEIFTIVNQDGEFLKFE
jgi:hypothetical protein